MIPKNRSKTISSESNSIRKKVNTYTQNTPKLDPPTQEGNAVKMLIQQNVLRLTQTRVVMLNAEI